MYHRLGLLSYLSNCSLFTIVSKNHHGHNRDSLGVNYEHFAAKSHGCKPFTGNSTFLFPVLFVHLLVVGLGCEWVRRVGSVVLTTLVGKLGCLLRETE